MIDYSQVEEVLNAQNVSQADQELVRKFFSSFSFEKRQQLMGIFLGHSDKIALFINLLKLKVEFHKKPTEELAAEIFAIEEGEIKSLMKELA
ncbi:MAG: hypothetical protein WC791_03895 [Candidatus Paceibacterota bacterium]|jgi:hypothetical protein